MFSIVIPLFNEEHNIVPLYNEILSSLKSYKDYEIIFVDDASTDLTLEKISNIHNNKLKIIKNNRNEGKILQIEL